MAATPPTPERYEYADDCWSCGRSLEDPSFGPKQRTRPRRCLYCGVNPEKSADVRHYPTPGELPILRRYMDLLDERERVIAVLRWRREPVRYSEIAEVLGISPDWARQTHRRALRKIRTAAGIRPGNQRS